VTKKSLKVKIAALLRERELCQSVAVDDPDRWFRLCARLEVNKINEELYSLGHRESNPELNPILRLALLKLRSAYRPETIAARYRNVEAFYYEKILDGARETWGPPEAIRMSSLGAAARHVAWRMEEDCFGKWVMNNEESEWKRVAVELFLREVIMNGEKLQ
jgi:hypothetical protein